MLTSTLILLLFTDIHYCLGDLMSQNVSAYNTSTNTSSNPVPRTTIISSTMTLNPQSNFASPSESSTLTHELSSFGKFGTSATTVHKAYSTAMMNSRTLNLNQSTVPPSLLLLGISSTYTVTTDSSTTTTETQDPQPLPPSAGSSTGLTDLRTSFVSPNKTFDNARKLNSTILILFMTTGSLQHNTSTTDRNGLPPPTAVPPKPPTKALIPLFFVIIIVSISSTAFLGALILGVYFCCRAHRRRRRKRELQAQERRNRRWVPLHGLARTTSSGLSRSSTDGSHQVSVLNRTDIILRQHPPRRTLSDSVDRRNSRLSLLMKRSSMKALHTPTMSCSTFKPNQQLYLPHIQVQVHVNGDVGEMTAESRVGSLCKLDEAEESKSTHSSYSPSGDCENSIVKTLLHTR